MIIPQNIGYPAYSNSIPMSYWQNYGSPEKKNFVQKGSQKISSAPSMSTESKIFKPKVSNTQKSHRDSMLNKTQINVGELSMMNQSCKNWFITLQSFSILYFKHLIEKIGSN